LLLRPATRQTLALFPGSGAEADPPGRSPGVPIGAVRSHFPRSRGRRGAVLGTHTGPQPSPADARPWHQPDSEADDGRLVTGDTDSLHGGGTLTRPLLGFGCICNSPMDAHERSARAATPSFGIRVHRDAVPA